MPKKPSNSPKQKRRDVTDTVINRPRSRRYRKADKKSPRQLTHPERVEKRVKDGKVRKPRGD